MGSLARTWQVGEAAWLPMCHATEQQGKQSMTHQRRAANVHNMHQHEGQRGPQTEMNQAMSHMPLGTWAGGKQRARQARTLPPGGHPPAGRCTRPCRWRTPPAGQTRRCRPRPQSTTARRPGCGPAPQTAPRRWGRTWVLHAARRAGPPGMSGGSGITVCRLPGKQVPLGALARAGAAPKRSGSGTWHRKLTEGLGDEGPADGVQHAGQAKACVQQAPSRGAAQHQADEHKGHLGGHGAGAHGG